MNLSRLGLSFSRRTRLIGFQSISSLSKDDKLTPDSWQKIRGYAKEKVDYFARQALAEFQSKTESDGSP
jgi:hypothetical protein